MRSRRKPRVFISYSHEDGALCERLTAWLRRNGFVPLVDRGGIHGGDRLSLTIIDLINRADYVFAIGTESFFRSDWGQLEVDLARSKGKPYYPIVVEPVAESMIPDWFIARDSRILDEIKYVQVPPHTDWSELSDIALRIHQRMPLELGAIVVMAFAVAFLLPMPILLVVRPLIGKAGEDVRQRQELVEEINVRLNLATKGRDQRVRLQSDGGTEGIWSDADTGMVLAKDRTEGTSVRERRFFRDGQEFAVDRIVVMMAPDGTSGLRKTRQIFAMDGSVIEDVFDSTGALVTKRFRRSLSAPWVNYADVWHSDYPAAYTLLVPFLPGPVLPGYR